MDAKKKSDEPGDDTDVFTQKHSENLFQRTEVLAGEAVFAKVYLTRNKTENRGDPYQVMQTQHLSFLGRFIVLNVFSTKHIRSGQPVVDVLRMNWASWGNI